MKSINKFLILAIMAVATVFASCSKDDDVNNVPSQQEIETKIVGKWKNVDEVVPTNKRIILSFLNKPQSFVSYCLYVVPLNSTMWCNRMSTEYAITNQNLNIKGDYSLFGKSVSMEFDLFVNRFDNEFMYATLLKQSAPSIGVEYNQPVDMTWKKVTADYSQDVLGLWEGVDMTGDETYGDAHHRIEYRADGTYTYYSWDEATQAWKPLEDIFDEWNVDGDWLATRWQNKGSDVMNYEWWDIDYIKDGIMKWSALREKEDGTRFTTTFTWKKVK